MAFEATKREWGELYAFFRLLAVESPLLLKAYRHWHL